MIAGLLACLSPVTAISRPDGAVADMCDNFPSDHSNELPLDARPLTIAYSNASSTSAVAAQTLRLAVTCVLGLSVELHPHSSLADTVGSVRQFASAAAVAPSPPGYTAEGVISFGPIGAQEEVVLLTPTAQAWSGSDLRGLLAQMEFRNESKRALATSSVSSLLDPTLRCPPTAQSDWVDTVPVVAPPVATAVFQAVCNSSTTLLASLIDGVRVCCRTAHSLREFEVAVGLLQANASIIAVGLPTTALNGALQHSVCRTGEGAIGWAGLATSLHAARTLAAESVGDTALEAVQRKVVALGGG